MSTYRQRIVLAWGSAALLAASPVGAAPSDSSGPAPAEPSEPSEPAEPDDAAAPASAEAPAAVGNARGALERGMTELGTLLTRARQSGDSTLLACVQDKRDRAEIVLEVATGEILVLQDPGADEHSRAFAGEKLSEAAARVSDLAGQARACQGGDAEARKDGPNEAKQPRTVIPVDPTAAGSVAPRLPPRIDPRPPVASPVL